MKTITKILSTVFLAVLFFSSCETDNDPEPEKSLAGKWNITNVRVLGISTNGDGSHLTFNDCDSTCSGIDYKASNQTTGSFTYTLNGESSVTIIDNSSNGGSYNGTWTINSFTATNLVLSINTILGEQKISLTKE
jgi:hypothetical protein